MTPLLYMILGLAGLWFGTEFVLKGAINIANYYNLSQLFVGLAILAIGTDLPEMVISINAALQNVTQGTETSGIIIGNAIGSSISQISLVLGVAGLLGYLTITRRHLFADGAMLIGSVVLVILLGYDGHLSRVDGIILVVVYIIYFISLFYQERIRDKISKQPKGGIRKDLIILVIGLCLVVYTSEVVVDNAVEFAEMIGLKQSLVGIILIGLGTSLPELAISLNATRKKANALSVGNLIGSNIFDMLMPIGVGAAISELRFEKSLTYFDLPFLLIVSSVVLYFFSRKKGLQRIEAVILIAMFAMFAALKVVGV